MAPNISLLALPVYWLVVMLTRTYTPLHLKLNQAPSHSSSSASNSASSAAAAALSSNANPHGVQTTQSIAKSLSPSAFARWERIQGAHRNGMENMALYYAAVLAGNYARLDALELSLCAWLFVLLRTLYVVLYVWIEGERASYARTATFGLGVFLCLWLLLRAGVYVLYGYHDLR